MSLPLHSHPPSMLGGGTRLWVSSSLPLFHFVLDASPERGAPLLLHVPG